MSEDDVRAGLRVAVADEPPFAFDPDLWISTAQRQLRRRRALVSVGVATTAIAVAAVAVPVGLGLTGHGTGYSAGAPPTGASSAAASGPHRYTAAELIRVGKRMAAVLRVEVPNVVPGATDVVVGEFGGEAAGDVHDGQDYLNAFVGYTLGGTRYALAVNVYAPSAKVGDRARLCAPPAQCHDIGARDGGQLRTQTVFHLRDNGSVVSIVGYNYDPIAAIKGEYQPVIPLALDQLVRLAVDENLGL